MARKVLPKDDSMWLKVVVIGLPILTFFGGAMFNAWGIATQLATKPYVDERIIEAKTYTDAKTKEVLDRAVAHSDANHQDMIIKFGESRAENRESMAKVSTNLENLIRVVQEIRDDAFEYVGAKRKHK